MKVFKEAGFDAACGARISYGFYGRTGGVSTGLYSSLNCGTGSKDDQTHIAQNRKRIADHLGAKDGHISTLWQCHSGVCLTVKDHVPMGENRPQADALVTDVAGLAIGVLTADCGPVLFCGEKADGVPVVGAAHAGWGGALGGILDFTVFRMMELGAKIDSITACIGPCILQPSYEVQNAFAEPFLTRHEAAERFFMTGQKDGHLHFDLPGYCAFRLSLIGVKTVRMLGVDTYANEDECFSYRRATHRGEPDYGRQMSAIMIKG